MTATSGGPRSNVGSPLSTASEENIQPFSSPVHMPAPETSGLMASPILSRSPKRAAALKANNHRDGTPPSAFLMLLDSAANSAGPDPATQPQASANTIYSLRSTPPRRASPKLTGSPLPAHMQREAAKRSPTRATQAPSARKASAKRPAVEQTNSEAAPKRACSENQAEDQLVASLLNASPAQTAETSPRTFTFFNSNNAVAPAPTTPAGSLQAPTKSKPRSSLPFPLLFNPFGRSPSVASTSTATAQPSGAPTPAAARTLYGTERSAESAADDDLPKGVWQRWIG